MKYYCCTLFYGQHNKPVNLPELLHEISQKNQVTLTVSE